MLESTPILCIMGPTASGKTNLAMALVPILNAEIISVDSAMVYRGMDIGTAKPTKDEQAIAPHHLIDLCDPSEPYSAARFRKDAIAAIESIRARGKVPILVGGTMLYYKALQHGLSPLPPADPAVRAYLSEQGEKLGWPAMHEKLSAIDPVAAARIKPTDPQRIQRALEVFEIKGKSMTDLCGESTLSASPYSFLNIAIAPSDRDQLKARIAKRFDEMLKRGLIDEVKGLYYRADLHQGLPSIRSVGYRQIWHYLDERWDYAQMRERAIITTRQLAKRQMTWLRSLGDRHWLETEDADSLDKVLSLVRRFNIIQLEDNNA